MLDPDAPSRRGTTSPNVPGAPPPRARSDRGRSSSRACRSTRATRSAAWRAPCRPDVRINGITEGKYYQNGTRADGDANPPNPDNLTGINMLYTGGDPVNAENYNIYKLTVLDTDGNELQHYYRTRCRSGLE